MGFTEKNREGIIHICKIVKNTGAYLLQEQRTLCDAGEWTWPRVRFLMRCVGEGPMEMKERDQSVMGKNTKKKYAKAPL